MAATPGTSGRADGRGFEEFRPNCAFIDPSQVTLQSPVCLPAMIMSFPPVINTKVISQAKGSAYAEFDATKVMVGV